MDVRCERCRAQYVFDDDQVTLAGLTVQCTNCGHLFKVKKKELVVTVPVNPGDVEGTPPSPAPPPPRAADERDPRGRRRGRGRRRRGASAARSSSPGMPVAAAPEPERTREWRVRQANGNIFTFRELTTLQKWIIEQKVGRDDEISLSGEQWKRLGNIAELASFFQVVEAAERSKTQAQPAITPMPSVAPVPVHGVAGQTPSLYQPTPSGSFPIPPAPSGFPPPTPSGGFALPPPAFPPASYAAQQPPPGRAPVHEVDLGIEEPPSRKKGGARTWLLVPLLLAAIGAGSYYVVPLLVPKPPPPPPPVVEAKPAPPPPEPPPAPVPAPEPVVQQAPTPPEPISRPAKVTPPQPKGPKALLARAKVLLERGDAAAALDLYGRVASDDQENVEALTGRGLCYLDLENWAPAEASFQAALRLEPDEADALLGLAETYRFRGKKAEAIATYERYLARYPGGEEAEVAKHALSELRK